QLAARQAIERRGETVAASLCEARNERKRRGERRGSRVEGRGRRVEGRASSEEGKAGKVKMGNAEHRRQGWRGECGREPERSGDSLPQGKQSRDEGKLQQLRSAKLGASGKGGTSGEGRGRRHATLCRRRAKRVAPVSGDASI